MSRLGQQPTGPLARVSRLLLINLMLGCAPALPARSSSVESFGPTDPRKVSTLLLGREAPNTTLLAMDAGVTGDRISGLLEIPAASCAIVIARAGESVDDLDLLAYGEDGSVVGTDEAPDKIPGLTICPPHPARVWLSARIAAGHGLVAIGAQKVSVANAERTAALYQVKPRSGARGQRLSPLADLEERIQAHRTLLGGSWQDLRRVPVPLDVHTPTRVSAQIEAGRCLDALLLPSPEVGPLELTAQDSGGAIVGRAQTTGRERYIVACSAMDTPISFEMRPQFGRGLGVLMFSRTRPGSEQDLDPVVTRVEVSSRAALAEEVRESQEVLARSGYAPGRPLVTGTLQVNRRMSLSVPLGAGCWRLDMIGGSPLRGVEAWVWSHAGKLISHATSGANLALFACGPGGVARLDLEAMLRSGPYTVFLRQEPGTHAALSASPLAAGRLLANLVERGVVRRASEVGLVTPVDLSPTELSRVDLTVPFGRCVDLTLALGADTAGAEVRLVALATDQEVAFSRGTHVTSARVCSLDAAGAQNHLKTRAELRVRAGTGRALFATRLLSPTR